MQCSSLVKWNLLVFYKIVLCSGALNVSINIDGLLVSKEDLEILTTKPTGKWPFCVFYRDRTTPLSRLEQSFVEFLRILPENDAYKEWNIVAFNLDKGMLSWEGHPGAVPLLQCHIGTAESPLSYSSPTKTHRTTHSVHQWFKNVNKLFAQRLPPLNINHLAGTIVSFGGYTMVGIPGHLHHQTVENTLKKLAKGWKERIKVLVVIPFTDEEMFMMEKYNVSQLPAVIVFSSQEWKETEKPLLVLQTVGEVEERRLETMLVTLHSQAHHLNLGNFADVVLETKHPTPPMTVCFYSPRNPRTLNYLNAFHRSFDTLTRMQVSLRFGMLNIVDHPEVVSRYVNASDVYAVPFTVVFWQERELTTQRFTIKQQVFDRDVPTPLLLFEFLQMLPVNLYTALPEDDDDDEPYNPWKESDDTKNVCNLLLQDACAIGDNNTIMDKTGFYNDVMFGPQLPPPSWQTKAKDQSKMKKKTFQFEYVNDKTWASLIEQSVGPVKSYTALPRKQSSRLFSVALVVFLKEGCGYCAKILPTIEKISLEAKYLGASVFVHNCSSDPLTCERYSITGYPTLTAFRSLSWSTVESCSSSHSTYLRLDYHGVVFAKDVLEWLSNISQPAVDRTHLFGSIPDMDVDVRLIGTLYTRSLARRYLATTLVNKWYPYNCFQLVCELLYGRVPCYVTYTRDVVDDGSKVNAKDQDLVLSKLELQRSDGVRVKVFQLGQSVESLINNQRDTRLHMFHDTHRYDMPKNFKCEHDHKICTDSAVRFVQDHRRLPVLHMTSAAFHTKLGSEENANFEPFAHNLPILFALAHKSNVSKDSSFYKELTKSAYAMYSEMVFVTLDIDEFAHWASRFVPRDYHAKHAFGRQAENVPVLYHYPRLCIIEHNDHQHAAFYPPIEELQRLGTRVQARLDQITSQQIIKFVQDYLKDPAALIVKTEFF